jgi:hypothetical protein
MDWFPTQHDQEVEAHLVVRTVLWIIAGCLFIGLVVWWSMT